jgi:hypothetical protein
VLAALDAFLLLHAAAKGLPDAAAKSLFDRLQREVMRPGGGPEGVQGDVPRLAQRLWTADLRLEGVPAAAARDLCGLLNSAIRDDDAARLRAAMPIVRAINALCVVGRERPDNLLQHPPDSTCYRGGGLPADQAGFFVAGRAYRVPGFLASSFRREVWPQSIPVAGHMRVLGSRRHGADVDRAGGTRRRGSHSRGYGFPLVQGLR